MGKIIDKVRRQQTTALRNTLRRLDQECLDAMHKQMLAQEAQRPLRLPRVFGDCDVTINGVAASAPWEFVAQPGFDYSIKTVPHPAAPPVAE